MAKKVKTKLKRKRKVSTEEEKWRAQDDLRTLRNAAEIGNDARRMAAAQREAEKEMAALKKVKKAKKHSRK